MRLRTFAIQTLMLATAVAIGAALPLGAQGPAASRVVVVDGDRVTNETAIGQEIRDRVANEAASWDSRLQQANSELQALAQNRQSQSLTLSSTALAQLDAQIEEKQVEIQRMQDDARRALERIQNESQARINDVLIPVLEQMAAEQGWGLVFDSRLAQTGSLLYFDGTVDVTDSFIQRVGVPQ